jgi:hypothetical protein
MWSYGVTTVPSRIGDLLPQTLHSLALAGFGEPRLFVDGVQGGSDVDYRKFDLPVTIRDNSVHLYPHWVLSAWELYFRNPWAEYYAIFQDDFVAVKNMRLYIEAVPYPERGYLNLFTFLHLNEAVIKGKPPGWYEAGSLNGLPGGPQAGHGAVALVFRKDAMIALLDSGYLATRVQDHLRKGKDKQPEKNGLPRAFTHADGGIVTAMNMHPNGPWREYVHAPSLVQHQGHKSTTGSGILPQARSFPGVEFDALDFLKIGK